MDSVFQALEISPRVKPVTVQNRFTPQKACQEQACAPSPSPWAGTVAVPGCMHGVVLAHRNPCSVMAGAAEKRVSSEPSSQTAIHVSHFSPLRRFLRWMLSWPVK